MTSEERLLQTLKKLGVQAWALDCARDAWVLFNALDPECANGEPEFLFGTAFIAGVIAAQTKAKIQSCPN